ncbi:claudin-2 [Megalops cyprinoides]|uniref:claudin-2 n=1 Tax=Megalops cyprinoides TaxID=118141 RepID=UPI001864D015|nr:claudin-2 [Megalops cyprinoides]
MGSASLELMGFFLGLLGMVGTLVATVLPYWRTSAFIGSNIVTAVVNMKGLWMECVHQSTGTFQCETYNSMLALPSDLQASRAMMVISTVLSVLGCATSSLGMQCTVCLDGTAEKPKVAGAGGCFFLLAGLFCLIPVSWTTHEVVQTFYHPNLPTSYKFELGECLFVGLASALMSMLGGGLLCVSCCEGQDGRRGTRRPGGGYPYPDRAASFPRATPHTMTYRNPTLQTGVNTVTKTQTQNASHASTSSQSSFPIQELKKSPRHNAASGYDVTGYV